MSNRPDVTRLPETYLFLCFCFVVSCQENVRYYLLLSYTAIFDANPWCLLLCLIVRYEIVYSTIVIVVVLVSRISSNIASSRRSLRNQLTVVVSVWRHFSNHSQIPKHKYPTVTKLPQNHPLILGYLRILDFQIVPTKIAKMSNKS